MTKRPKTLVFNECYHGSLDEALVHLDDKGQMGLRCEFDSNPGLVNESVSRVVEFNDVVALEEALCHRDVACILAEPVMTNCGVLVTPFHNMMLVSPVTTDGDIDLLVKGWEDCMAELAAVARIET